MEAIRKQQEEKISKDTRKSVLLRKEKEQKEIDLLFADGGSGVLGYELDFADQDESNVRQANNRKQILQKVDEMRKKFEKGEKLDYDSVKDPRIILELNSQIYNSMITESREQQDVLRKAILEMEIGNNVEL